MSTPYPISVPSRNLDFQVLLPKLREDLRQLDVTNQTMDVGTPVRTWSPRRPPRLTLSGASDGQVDFQEVLQKAFYELEEIAFGRTSYDKDLCGLEANRSFFCLFRERTTFLPPWFLDDGKSETTEDSELRGKVETVVAAAQKKCSSHRALTEALLRSLLREKSEGGLGLNYNSERTDRKKDGVEAYLNGSGDCNALAFLFYAMARRAGLNPTFIRVSGKRSSSTGTIQEIFHIAVAVRLDTDRPDQLTAVDPSRGIFLDDDYQWYPITPLEMTAYHLRNVAFTNVPDGMPEGDSMAWQESLLKNAETLAPNDFEIQYDLSKFYLEIKKDSGKALHHIKRVERLNPSLRATWNDQSAD